MGGGRGAAAVPASPPSSRPRSVRLRARRAARRLRGVRATSAPVVEGLSIDEAFLDVTGLERISRHADARSRPALSTAIVPRAGRAADHRRGRVDQAPGESRERSGEAGRPARWCRRAASATFLPTRCPSSALGRRAGDRGEAATRTAVRDGRRRGARRRERALARPPGARRRAGTSTRSPAVAARDGSRAARGGGGSIRVAVGAARTRRSPRSERSSDASSWLARRPRQRGDALPRPGSGATVDSLAARASLRTSPRGRALDLAPLAEPTAVRRVAIAHERRPARAGRRRDGDDRARRGSRCARAPRQHRWSGPGSAGFELTPAARTARRR